MKSAGSQRNGGITPPSRRLAGFKPQGVHRNAARMLRGRCSLLTLNGTLNKQIEGYTCMCSSPRRKRICVICYHVQAPWNHYTSLPRHTVIPPARSGVGTVGETERTSHQRPKIKCSGCSYSKGPEIPVGIMKNTGMDDDLLPIILECTSCRWTLHLKNDQ